MGNDIKVIRNEEDRKAFREQTEIDKRKTEADRIQQMSTPQGRRFVWDVLKKLSYNTAIQDINAKVYGAVAKQEVALAIAKELKESCRESFYLMETENEKER